MPLTKSLVVLGCGRSLAKFPFDKYKVDTLGMNNAYRYWHKINWYPTYYCCLDVSVSRFYARDIKTLIDNRQKYGIKRFLLSPAFLEKYPNYKKYSCCDFGDKINKSRNKGFTGNTKMTTGSFSVRYGIYLGYQKIYILGVDANYRPININWVKSITDENLILKRTVNPEPDYFFVGYRQKGDLFHLPPKRRWSFRSNHLAVFEQLNKEFNRNGKNKVVNANQYSMLYRRKTLPYEAIPSSFLEDDPSHFRDQVENKSLKKDKKSDKKNKSKDIHKNKKMAKTKMDKKKKKKNKKKTIDFLKYKKPQSTKKKKKKKK